MGIDFRYEMLIGVDEVGVGPLAGAVTAAAVTAPAKFSIFNFQFSNLRDSKQLSAKQREEFFKIFCENPNIHWAVASVMPKTIDKINIFQARRLAMRRAVQKITLQYFCDRKNIVKFRRKILLLIDGNTGIDSPLRQRCIIKGDEQVPIIAAASIIAKVTRDRAMLRYHRKYPEYRFDLHKGYGTRLHYEMLAKYGPCAIHRMSFRLA